MAMAAAFMTRNADAIATIIAVLTLLMAAPSSLLLASPFHLIFQGLWVRAFHLSPPA